MAPRWLLTPFLHHGSSFHSSSSCLLKWRCRFLFDLVSAIIGLSPLTPVLGSLSLVNQISVLKASNGIRFSRFHWPSRCVFWSSSHTGSTNFHFIYVVVCWTLPCRFLETGGFAASVISIRFLLGSAKSCILLGSLLCVFVAVGSSLSLSSGGWGPVSGLLFFGCRA